MIGYGDKTPLTWPEGLLSSSVALLSTSFLCTSGQNSWLRFCTKAQEQHDQEHFEKTKNLAANFIQNRIFQPVNAEIISWVPCIHSGTKSCPHQNNN